MCCENKKCPCLRENSLQRTLDYSRNSVAMLMFLVKELTGKDVELLMSKKDGGMETIGNTDYLGAKFINQKDSS